MPALAARREGNEVKNSIVTEGAKAEEEIKKSRKHAEDTIALHQKAIDKIKGERETLEKAHSEFRRSVGV